MVGNGTVPRPHRLQPTASQYCHSAWVSEPRGSVGSQSPQPHLEDSTTYHPRRPTQRGSNLRVARGTKAHSPPSHISKTVLSTVHVGGPSGGLEPCRCSRPVRDAAPQSLPQSSAVTGSRPTLALVNELTGGPRCAGPGQRAHRRGPRCAGHGRRAHRLPQIRPDVLDAPDFVGIGAKPTREDGQRGRRNGGGSPWVPCHLARPRPPRPPKPA